MIVAAAVILSVTILAVNIDKVVNTDNNQEGLQTNDEETNLLAEDIELSTGLHPINVVNQMTPTAPGSNLKPDPQKGGVGLLAPDKTMYAYNTYDSSHTMKEGPVHFQLNNLGDVTLIAETTITQFISGATWTNDGRWLGCEFTTGDLYELDPDTGAMTLIGGGGDGLNGLAYDPVTEKLYGAGSYDFYEVDINTGAQTHIGAYGGSALMIGIAFDANGVLYGWDIIEDKLWTIDTGTGLPTEVGPLGFDILYAQDGAFDYEDDTLYLTAYVVAGLPDYGGNLVECDEDTGACTQIGPFANGMQISGSAIPYEAALLETDVDIKPETLNLKSNGKWVTVHIGLSAGYDVNDIDIGTVALEGIPADWGKVTGDKLKVKFSRAALIEHIRDVLGITEGDVELTVTGNLLDSTPIEGSDTIYVHHG